MISILIGIFALVVFILMAIALPYQVGRILFKMQKHQTATIFELAITIFFAGFFASALIDCIQGGESSTASAFTLAVMISSLIVGRFFHKQT